MSGECYYNEFEERPAKTLRYRISTGDLPEGDVDERDIKEVKSEELLQYQQCHFFAGIGGWPLALQRAAWPADYPVWTGSPPCQPFSQAGKRRGFEDSRHLWPVWYNLVREQTPPVIFGEQVTGPDAEVWLDRVWADMEAAGYAFAPFVLCAAGVGAPHPRHRFFWVAHRSEQDGRADGTGEEESAERGRAEPAGGCESERVEDTARPEATRYGEHGREGIREPESGQYREGSNAGRVGNPEESDAGEEQGVHQELRKPQSAGGMWDKSALIWCEDGAYRRIEPGTLPLDDGVSDRMGQIAGYGNAIVVPLAVEFITAYMETVGLNHA